jgi:hypothetical protein
MEMAIDWDDPVYRASVQADLAEEIPHLIPLGAGLRWWGKAISAEIARRRIAAEQKICRDHVAWIVVRHGVPIPMLMDRVPPDMPPTTPEKDIEEYFKRRGFLDPRTPRPWPGYKLWSFPGPME